MLVESTSKLVGREANCWVRTVASGGWRQGAGAVAGGDVMCWTVTERLVGHREWKRHGPGGEFSVRDAWLWLQAVIPLVKLERQVHY